MKHPTPFQTTGTNYFIAFPHFLQALFSSIDSCIKITIFRAFSNHYH